MFSPPTGLAEAAEDAFKYFIFEHFVSTFDASLAAFSPLETVPGPHIAGSSRCSQWKKCWTYCGDWDAVGGQNGRGVSSFAPLGNFLVEPKLLHKGRL